MIDLSENIFRECKTLRPTSTLYDVFSLYEGVPLATVKESLNHFNTCPAQLILVMQKLLQMPAPDVWQFSELLVSQIKEFMRPEVPQLISQLFGKLWFHMNGVFPRKLWTLTVNYMNHVVNGRVTSLRTMKKITQVCYEVSNQFLSASR